MPLGPGNQHAQLYHEYFRGTASGASREAVQRVGHQITALGLGLTLHAVFPSRVELSPISANSYDHFLQSAWAACYMDPILLPISGGQFRRNVGFTWQAYRLVYAGEITLSTLRQSPGTFWNLPWELWQRTERDDSTWERVDTFITTTEAWAQVWLRSPSAVSAGSQNRPWASYTNIIATMRDVYLLLLSASEIYSDPELARMEQLMLTQLRQDDNGFTTWLRLNHLTRGM